MEPGQEQSHDSIQQLLKQVRNKTDQPAVQPSRHCSPEAPLPPIPSNVSRVYTRQHQKTGLQAHFEGPFPVVERVSNSVMKIEVGSFKDGRKRYEFRHINDLKFAHPKSLAAPVERPKLGRPAATSVPTNGQTSTEAASSGSPEPPSPQNRFDEGQLPHPSVNNKQAAGSLSANETARNHATSNQEFRVPASAPARGLTNESGRTGPPPAPAFSARPVRSTRNPSPIYVDSIQWSTLRPWSATQNEIQALNSAIGG